MDHYGTQIALQAMQNNDPTLVKQICTRKTNGYLIPLPPYKDYIKGFQPQSHAFPS